MGKWLVALLLLLLVSLTAAPAGAVRFVDIGTSLNLPSTLGVAWGDYDDDGRPDLYLGALWGVHRAYLMHNDGDGTFTDVTIAMGLRTETSAWEDMGCAWGDFNNDGRLDLVVAGGNHLPFLYRNDGDHFTDIGGAAAGFSDVWYTARGVAWGDYDGDNWLDLYVANDHWSAPSFLYRNNRDGTFTEVTNEAGMDLAVAGYSVNCSWADYDNDGFLDLTVARERDAFGSGSPVRLYTNDQDGTFTDLGAASGVGTAGNTYGLAWADYDNDGWFDLYLSTGPSGGFPWLFHSNGDGTFANRFSAAGMEGTGEWWSTLGPAWADYDNDGFLDLAVSNQDPQPLLLFHNSGDGTFTRRETTEGIADWRARRGMAWADFNGDGRPDLLAASADGYSALYQNTGAAADGNWLRIRALTDSDGDATDGDTTDDRDAIGARVWVNLDNDATFPSGGTLQRIIDGGSGYLSQNEQVAHFGLGDAATVAVRVAFPDHSVVTQAGVVPGQELVLRDPYQPTGIITGTVTDAASELPIYHALVTCGYLTVRTSVSGAYHFALVPEGSYDVTVEAEGYAPQTAAAVVVAGGGTTTRDFALDPAPGAIEGHITDAATSAVVAGATVSAGGETATTEADGSYLLSGLAPGSYTVTATAAGYQQASHSGAVVVSGETTVVDLALTLLSIGAVHGVVREATTTSPIAGAVVTCGPMRVLTNSSGAYSFPAVTAGSYTLGAAAGGYWWSAAVTVEVEAGYAITQDFALAPMAAPAQQFQDVSPTSGFVGALGAAWGDYDGDGDPDLFLSGNVNAAQGMTLLRNDGGLTFADVSASASVPTAPALYDGVAWADYDGDGDLDVFVGGDGGVYDRLLNNDGGAFVNVATGAGLTWEQPARTATWGDYDRDNWLDLFVGYVGSGDMVAQLFHNDGDGTFTRANDQAGMVGAMAPVDRFAVTWADLDNDGWLDLICSPGAAPGRPLLYHNDGDGGFTEVGASALIPVPERGGTAAVCDYDNDGWLDIAFGGPGGGDPGLLLYQSNHDGTFSAVTAAAGLAEVALAIGTIAWADYDNDGWADLYASCFDNPPLLYHNNGDGTFANVAAVAGLNGVYQNQAAVWGDPDLDGSIDLFQAVQEGSRLYHNTGTAGNWLRVRALTDRDGAATDQDLSDDRDAIGARVELSVDNDGSFPPGRTLTRVVSGGSGFLGQDEPIAQFGVPVDSSVAVRVTFPDGSVVVRRGLALNQQLAIRDKLPEPSSSFWDVPSDSWALAAIEAAVEAGVVQGYWDNTYHPERVVTRDQMAVYIARALAGGDGNVPTGTAAPTFTDVGGDHWAYRHVEYCAGLDIVQGYWDNTYHPDEVVNRGQMAVYIARAVATPVGEAGVPEAGATPTFPDVTADNDWSWCYNHVEYVADLGIVQGYWDGYHPEREVTRDQMAVYVARAFELLD